MAHHDDADLGKKLKTVNAFKAPEGWYANLIRVSEERQMTLGATIQYLCNLGMPVYDIVKQAEQNALDNILADMKESAGKKGAA